MPDVEKVIKWLEICIKGCDDSCPYKKECESKGGFTEPMRDALDLLKAPTIDAIPVEWLKKVRKDASEGDSLDVGIAEVLDMWEKEQEAR